MDSTEDYYIHQAFSKSYIAKLEIAQTFNQLAQEMPYEKIGVSSITSRAGISRSGFYHHFEDKNAVINWICFHAYEVGLDQIGRTLTWFEGHLMTTKKFMAFAPLVTVAHADSDYQAPRPSYVRHREEMLKDTLINYQHKELTRKLAFQIHALPYAESTAAMEFIGGKTDCSLKDYCDLVTSLTPVDLYNALNNPVSKRDHQGTFF